MESDGYGMRRRLIYDLSGLKTSSSRAFLPEGFDTATSACGVRDLWTGRYSSNNKPLLVTMLGSDSSNIPPVSSHCGFTISAYVVGDTERYRNTDKITGIPLLAAKRLMNLVPDCLESASW